MRRKLVLTAIIGATALLSGPAQSQYAPVSNRCFTPQFWCWLPGFGPVGTPCFCNTPYGPVNGVVR